MQWSLYQLSLVVVFASEEWLSSWRQIDISLEKDRVTGSARSGKRRGRNPHGVPGA